MAQNNAITVHKQDLATMPSQNEWALMMEMAAALVPTGFLPTAIKTPAQAVAIMLKGRELGIPPMQALANIAIINGKPTIQAELMLAIVYRDHGKAAFRIKSSDDLSCVAEYRLAGWPDIQSYAFTIDQAKKAGLIKPGPWQQYPAAMLRARCISAVARMAFPESIGGMYVPGELGEAVTVSDDGEVRNVSTATVIDSDTGEITTDNGADDDRPGRVERVMRRLHAVSEQRGIDHDMLHNWAVSKGVQSLSDITIRDLEALADHFEARPESAEQFIAKFQAANANQGSLVDLNDPELVAAANAVQDKFRGDGATA
jgi:hypothetical protein